MHSSVPVPMQRSKACFGRPSRPRRDSFVILLHNFELMNQAKNRRDDVVVERFRRLCAFLDRNRKSFCVRGFNGISPHPQHPSTRPLGVTRLEDGRQDDRAGMAQEISMTRWVLQDVALKFALSDLTLFTWRFRFKYERSA